MNSFMDRIFIDHQKKFGISKVYVVIILIFR